MPKHKTHKGLMKRIRITRTGKIMRKKAGRRHLLSSKSRSRKRHLRGKVAIARVDLNQIKRTLHS